MTHTRWQYLVRNGLLTQDLLNDIGNDGWELVSVAGDPSNPDYYFKRPHPSLREAITLEQRERYFEEWGVEKDALQ